MSEALVSVRGLSKTFDVSPPWLDRVLERLPRQLLHAVTDVSFEIRKGGTFALVGESGSGKSTIAKVIVGLLSADGGEIEIDGVTMGRDTAAVRRLRRRMQMIFQDPYASLNPRMRVDRIVAEPIRAFGLLSGRAVDDKVGALLEAVGLSARDGQKFPHEFSGGQRQRICIARALASSPAFLVCDEPTSALDVSVQAQILNLMKDLQDEFSLTYLFISHDLAVVRHMADTIGVLYLGRLAEVAPAKELFSRPRHPYTRMLLDAVPDLDMSGRARTPVTGEIPNPIDPPPGCPFNPRCPLAAERCRVEVPLLKAAGDALVACHAVEEGRAGPGETPAATALPEARGPDPHVAGDPPAPAGASAVARPLPPVDIRPARRTDRPALAAMLRKSWMETWAPHCAPRSVARFIREDPVSRGLDESLDTIRVATIEGRIVGQSSLSGDTLADIHVERAFQGRGIGSALMDDAEAAGARRIYVRAFNTRAIRFYERRGWRLVRRHQGAELGTPVETLEYGLPDGPAEG